jgi:hypothetical protein
MSRLDDVTISRQAWGAKPPKQTDTDFTKTGGMVIHYSTRNAATLVNHWPDCYESWRNHQRYHQVTKGWWDLAYDWGVCPHGYAFEGRGWGVQNGANRPVNTSTLSICYDGDANDRVGAAATQTFKEIIERGVMKEGWTATVRGHYEVSTSGTPCPGTAIRSVLLPKLKTFVAGLGSATVVIGDEPDPPAPTFDKIAVLGPPTASISRMQRWAKTNNASPLFVGLAPVAWRESVDIGVDPAVTYAIMAHETAFGRFGGVLDATYANWGGIKTFVGGGDFVPMAHHVFPGHEIGVRAVAQHAGRYAGLELWEQEIVDPRWNLVTPGVAPRLPDDDWAWAKDSHDDRVVAHIRRLRQA